MASLLGPGAALAALWLLFALAASASAGAAGGLSTPQSPQLFPVAAPTAGVNAQLSPQAAQIDFRKTVGTNLSACASTKAVTVTAGTVVAYCFVTYNTGTITLTHHSANDTQIGVLLNNTVFTLGPGAGVFFTVTREISVTVVNTATWIASNPGPTDQATDTDSAKVAVLSFLYLPSLLK